MLKVWFGRRNEKPRRERKIAANCATFSQRKHLESCFVTLA